MPKGRESGFQSAAGLIRYFDQEDEKAVKVLPWIVVILAVAIAAMVLFVTWQWPV